MPRRPHQSRTPLSRSQPGRALVRRREERRRSRGGIEVRRRRNSRLGHGGARRPKRNERAAANELPHRRLGPQITPAQNRREEAHPPRMAAPKTRPPQRRSRLQRGIAARERTSRARFGPAVPGALGDCGSIQCSDPGRKDDRLARARLVGQRHGDRLVSISVGTRITSFRASASVANLLRRDIGETR